MPHTACETCSKPIRIKPSEYNPSGNFCGWACRSWSWVQRHLDARNAVSMQVFRAGIAIGRQHGLPPGTGSLHLLHQRFGINATYLSAYVAGRRLKYPSQANVDCLQRMMQDMLGEPLHWQGTTWEQWLADTFARDGAKRFRGQTRKERAKIYAKRIKAQQGRPRQPRPDVSARLRRYWADPQWKQHAIDRLRDQAHSLRNRVLSAYGKRKEHLGRDLRSNERKTFVIEKSKKFHRPASWIRSILDSADGGRRRGQPLSVDRYDRILRHRRRDGRIDWDRAVADVAKTERLVLATPGKRAAFRESLQAAFWRARPPRSPIAKIANPRVRPSV